MAYIQYLYTENDSNKLKIGFSNDFMHMQHCIINIKQGLCMDNRDGNELFMLLASRAGKPKFLLAQQHFN